MRFLWIVLVLCVKCSAMSRDELEDFSDFLKKTSILDLNVKKGADPDDIFDEDEEISDHAWEESGKFEGDLILNDRQRRLIIENVEGLSRNGLTDSTKRWPNNEVIYFIQREHFNSDQVQAIEDGIEDLGRASCVKFRPYKKGDRDAVVIQGSRRGCFSQVGYQGGYQVLNLSGRHPAGRGCFRHGTVVHELLHTLGFYHMQSSPDRDDYINVIWENIIQPARHNFRKYNSFSVSDFGVGYDYDSVLHYSRRAFSSNGKDTLVPKQSGAQIGQRVGLSDKDTQKLNKMYCDPDTITYDAVDVSTKPKHKKKKPKNKPFEGHGIGYHQGKTVIIKVPTSETYKLPPNPSFIEFDFRGTPQVLPPSKSEDYSFGKEIAYAYNPNNQATYMIEPKPVIPSQNGNLNPKLVENISTEKEKSLSNESDSNEEVTSSENSASEELDEDLEEAFDRLAALAKQRIYPQKTNNEYPFKVNEDYSEFYPPSFKKLNTDDNSYGGKYKETVLYDDSSDNRNKAIIDAGKLKKQTSETVPYITQTKPVNYKDIMDSSFRTALPIKKPYSFYDHTETPDYATRDYLKDRHIFDQYYTGKKKESPETTKQPFSDDEWYKKDDLRKKPENTEPYYKTDSEEDEKGSQEEEEEESLEYNSENKRNFPKKSSEYVLLDSTVPSKQNWYKPNYSIPKYESQSYENSESVEHSDR